MVMGSWWESFTTADGLGFPQHHNHVWGLQRLVSARLKVANVKHLSCGNLTLDGILYDFINVCQVIKDGGLTA